MDWGSGERRGRGGIDSYDLLSPTGKDPKAFKIEPRLKLGISSPRLLYYTPWPPVSASQCLIPMGLQQHSRELVGRSRGYLE